MTYSKFAIFVSYLLIILRFTDKDLNFNHKLLKIIFAAYILADQGYDVWMGNSRGNTYSRGHEQFLPTDSKYWNFSFHEMGVYDLPATIDYILAATKQPKIYFLGHSQGTTSFFVMMAIKPEYNDKIFKFAAYAPMAYMANVRSPFIKFTAKLSSPLYVSYYSL